MSSTIVICDKPYDIGHRVVSYEESAGFSAYLPHRSDDPGEPFASDPAPGLEGRRLRYRRRRALGGVRTLAQLSRVVRQVVLHLDGCRDAAMCYDVLHNGRGLSVHFLIDCDGTIYQTLDIADCAFHAGGVNEVSVGIELQNRGDAARYPDYYETPRPTVTCTVHGAQFLAYDFTNAQYDAAIALCRALVQLLRIPRTSPRAGGGELVWTTIDRPRRFAGILGHYHVSRNKWDPGPWDFRRLLRGMTSRVQLPLSPVRADGLPRSPEGEDAAFDAALVRYHESAERVVEAHFPLGPLGQSSLWHGGVHLAASESDPIRAPIPGEIAAVQMRPPCPVGSCSFILLKHHLEAAQGSFEFFSLFFHIQDESERWGYPPLPWLVRNPHAVAMLNEGRVAFIGDTVDAGEVIAHVGMAGPVGSRRGQIHFAVFAPKDVGRVVDRGYWQIIEGGRRSRFCHDREIIALIDRPGGGKPRDGHLSRRELRNFFRFEPQREELRRTAIHYRAEWTPGDWLSDLAQSEAFRDMLPEEQRALVAQQIRPTLFWTPALARRVGLPPDGYVFAYHPLGFLKWYRMVLRREADRRAVSIGSAAQWRGVMAPAHLTVDAESAAEMLDDEDLVSADGGKALTLEDLVNGYPE